MTTIQGLFVYGTLRHRPDRPNDREKGFIRGHMFDIGSFPGVILDANGLKIEGEILYPVDDDLLASYDRYEGYNVSRPEQSLYIRTTTNVYTESGVQQCWIYEYNHSTEGIREIGSGSWFERWHTTCQSEV